MRTTLDLPGQLLAKARRASGARTKTETIIMGLTALVRQKTLERFWRTRGKISLNLDLGKSRAR